MKIEQAKQTLLCIKSENLCIDDTRIKERYDALNMAIKSLEMWDKIIKEIEDEEQLSFMYGCNDMYKYVNELRGTIEKYKKEIEE